MKVDPYSHTTCICFIRAFGRIVVMGHDLQSVAKVVGTLTSISLS